MSTTTAAPAQVTLPDVPFASIRLRGDFNPRTDAEHAQIDELAKSIEARGLLVPPIAAPLLDDPDGFDYELIAGERRMHAMRKLGWPAVPQLVVRTQADAGEQLIDAITENFQRVDMTLTEEAEAFGRLRAQGLTQREIAAQLGCSQKLVSARLALLNVTAAARQLFADAILTPSFVGLFAGLTKASPALCDLVATGVLRCHAEGDLDTDHLSTEPLWYVDGHAATAAGILLVEFGRISSNDLPAEGELAELMAACKELQGHNTTITIGDGLRDRAKAYGAFYECEHVTDMAFCDLEWLQGELVQPVKALLKALQDNAKAAPATESTVAPASNGTGPDQSAGAEPQAEPTEAEKAEARKAQDAAALSALQGNAQLGRDLAARLSSIDLTYDTAVLLVDLVLRSGFEDVALRGYRYTDIAQRFMTTRQLNNGRTVIERTGPLANIAHEMREFLVAEGTGEQVLARLMQVILAAGLTDQSVIPQTHRAPDVTEFTSFVPRIARTFADQVPDAVALVGTTDASKLPHHLGRAVDGEGYSDAAPKAEAPAVPAVPPAANPSPDTAPPEDAERPTE